METTDQIALLTLISTITDKAITCNDPGYRNLVTAATAEAGEGVPAYMATFNYLHRNLNHLSTSSKKAST